MEFLGFVGAFCLVVSFMVAPCASDDLFDDDSAQRSLQPFGDSAVQMISLQPLLPRKLQLVKRDAVKEYFVNLDADIIRSRKLLIQTPSGKNQDEQEEEEEVTLHQQQQQKLNQRSGTWREWIESPNKSDFFTMDYHWVRRRRPIHNKNFPFVP
ncbi:uncharacterized protein LOC127264059 [Andrographis paniculata]|uniref:uncharacterized protein LOC127264059 n=1 Tax=Andrographis paniculata TaxID=175694 RepID=UPI0021E8F226|nr:uncharacterized protein LOC127264059 [Andrographis paniculata]